MKTSSVYIAISKKSKDVFEEEHPEVLFDLVKTGINTSVYKTSNWEKGMEGIHGDPIDIKYEIGSVVNIKSETKKITNHTFDQVNQIWKVKYIFEDDSYLYQDQIKTTNP